MAILTIPCIGLSLLPHSSGGAILAGSSGYIANAFVGAEIVSAFTTASAALAKIGAVGAGVATSPAALTAATIAVVAVGGFCYFYGIPAPVSEMLASVGLGSSAHAGFVIPVPELAVALVILGGAGYVYYKFYETQEAVAAEGLPSAKPKHASSARKTVEALFGKEAWSKFGAAAWSTIGDAAQAALKAAQEAVELVSDAASAISEKAAGVGFDENDANAAPAWETATGPSHGVIAKMRARIRKALSSVFGAR